MKQMPLAGALLITSLMPALSETDDLARALKNIAFVMSAGMSDTRVEGPTKEEITYYTGTTPWHVKKVRNCVYQVHYTEGRLYQVDFSLITPAYYQSRDNFGMPKFFFPAQPGGSCIVGPGTNQMCHHGLRTTFYKPEEAEKFSQSIAFVQQMLCPPRTPTVGPRY